MSDLDAWERFVRPEREEFEVSPESFLAYMRRESEATEPMKAGSAFHALLERATEGEVYDLDGEGVACEGFRFFFGQDIDLALPPVREELIERIYPTSSGPVLLRGKLDGRKGLEVTDYKLTTGQFDAERYAGSWQWKAYLDMTGAKRFRYVVFTSKLHGRRVFVNDAHPMTLWSYPEIGEQVRTQVDELASFVREHLPELCETEAAA